MLKGLFISIMLSSIFNNADKLSYNDVMMIVFILKYRRFIKNDVEVIFIR